jgi:curved DNA-binding protein CbpA
MANRKPLDLQGHYRVLKVASDASLDEIRLSYAMAKQNASGALLKRIEDAFEALKDQDRRSTYDREGLEGSDLLRKPVTLAAAFGLLVIILAAVYGPGILRGMKSFREGQRVSDARTGHEFGTVIRYEPSHHFPQGSTLPAYLVRMAGTGEERWFPAYDMQASLDGR